MTALSKPKILGNEKSLPDISRYFGHNLRAKKQVQSIGDEERDLPTAINNTNSTKNTCEMNWALMYKKNQGL